ncbi:MAG: AAA family ATPase [Bacteroidales bacterium]|nr:AAA family ATPase [Bacteroidales bacterium]
MVHREHHEYATPEHLLYALCDDEVFARVFMLFTLEYPEVMKGELDSYLQMLEKLDTIADPDTIEFSSNMQIIYSAALQTAQFSGCSTMTIPHLVGALLKLDDNCYAYSVLTSHIEDTTGFLAALAESYGSGKLEEEEDIDWDAINEALPDDLFGNNNDFAASTDNSAPWRKFVTDITEMLRKDPGCRNPLIGREAELERTIQVLCRCDKNNPLHVGEPGVGKTALVYGLARRILEGRVPERLQDSSMFLLDLGSMLADTQYRGDFEKRIKMVMEGISELSQQAASRGKGAAIVYIDEIHNIVGAGQIGENSLDAANMLKPYLESGTIRFIGSTTYAEFNRHFSKSPGMIRRFQQIDIPEPSVDDTIQILEGLRSRYETYHGVVYDKGVLEHAVRMADRYINDRFLPDKAIDLIDEAGAFVEVRGKREEVRDSGQETIEDAIEDAPEAAGIVTRQLINDVLARICKVTSFADDEDDTASLADLDTRIKGRIYGQDEAVQQVVEAVQMSRAGLLDDGKPVASFLFVGPTGVGKTEVARVLAQELNLELIRFDMSEYAEKHTVAKLIGSPAGYVGYEDGGLLVDAVRKNPHCVLLFDEIEKAHPDVFNIFLQMMDYARLTDNKGRKADFRHAVIIMTSNAGAQFASQASVGFSGGVSRGEAMLTTVKKTFKPEFIARLSATVVFHDMDAHMAEMIFDKKLREFSEKLAAKHVTMTLTPAARQQLLTEGFTQKTGAREMDRVIAQHLKPLFTRAILFGDLKNGGDATVDYSPESGYSIDVRQEAK